MLSRRVFFGAAAAALAAVFGVPAATGRQGKGIALGRHIGVDIARDGSDETVVVCPVCRELAPCEIGLVAQPKRARVIEQASRRLIVEDFGCRSSRRTVMDGGRAGGALGEAGVSRFG